MSEIQILDVSGYIHTAQKVQKFAEARERFFPVGGLRFILRKITAELRFGSRVVCCFDGATNRSSRFPGYKGNRKTDPSVVAQCEFLYDLLSRCGVECYKGHGEADDYIYNIVEQYWETLDDIDRIIINGADYDLCHNVTEYGVEYKTINTNTNCVSWNNFSQAVGAASVDVFFNTIAAYKVLHKDKSDCIPVFKCDNGTTGLSMYKDYVAWWKSKGKMFSGRVTRRRDLLEAFLASYDLSSNDLSRLKLRMDAVYPKDLTKYYPEGFRLSDKNTVDMTLLADYCFVIKDFTSLSNLRQLGVRPRSEDDLVNLQNELFELGKDFNNGAYQADRNLSMKECHTFSDLLNVREI